MKMHTQPLILLSNDDGVRAKGLNFLIETLRPFGELVVMAPDRHRSGYGCSITSSRPVWYNEVSRDDNLTIYKCSGSPVDCTKLALHILAPRRPDLIVAGINHGDNSSVNVHYSGTMGIVIEGCMKGIPSIGFSLCDYAADADFSPTAPYIERIVTEVMQQGLPQGICLNVNFPAQAPYQGHKICRQTKGNWSHEWEERQHPHGNTYYWLTGEFQSLEPEAQDTDQWALAHGYVAITPTQTDVTAYQIIPEFHNWNLEL